jgi:prepilin peptidase CpaA
MIDAARFTLLALVLVAAAWTDLRRGIVPNRLTGPAIALGLIMAVVIGWATGGPTGAMSMFIHTLLVTAAGLGAMAMIFFAGGIGGGDVKLVGAIAAISGSGEYLLGALLYGLIAAMIMAVALMIKHGIVKRTLYRIMGAALSAAARVKPVMPDDSPTIPFAAALCFGGLLAGVEHILGFALPWS